MKKIIFLSVLIIILFSTVFIIQIPADMGQCLSGCASEQGICISQCGGDSQCISRCAAAHDRCVARCN